MERREKIMAKPENGERNNRIDVKLFSGMRNNHDYPGVVGNDWQFNAETNSYDFVGKPDEINSAIAPLGQSTNQKVS